MNNIESYNDKGQRHGYWEVYWSDDDLAFKCLYINGNESGYEEYHDKFIEINFHL